VHARVMFARLARFAFAWPLLAGLAGVTGCGGQSLMPAGPDWQQFIVNRRGTNGPWGYTWRPDVCAGTDMKPDYRTLQESNVVDFLRSQNYNVRVERQPVEPGKPDLFFVFVQVSGMAESVPLRVATLKTPDEAGHALNEALVKRGKGYWGVHRSNVAVFGPSGDPDDDLAFAAKTKLACWGTFTFHAGDEIYVVPGGYTEP
jgi:hypothetical protein